MRLTNLLIALLLPLSASAAGKIINADIAAAGTANIARNKLASGTNFAWCVNNGSGVMADTAVTASRAVATDSNGAPTASATTAAELGFVNGVTSAIQTQLNGKQATGNYITALTGDGTASGPGSAALTFATVNGNVGSFTNGSFTVNAKGLITAAASGTAPVTSLTVATANGFAGSFSASVTPALTLTTTITGILSGNGTAISAASTTGSGSVVLATAPTITTPTIAKLANLTSNGIVTTSGGDGTLSITATTGSGNVVLATSPTIVTPTIAKLANLTTNGFVKTSGGDGTLGVQTSPIPAADINGGRTINAQTGTTYTFALADASNAGGFPLVTGSNASAETFTVPPQSSVVWLAGSQIDVCQIGAGKLTLAQGAGVTINSLSSNKAIGGQYVCVSLIRTASDVWLLTGTLIP